MPIIHTLRHLPLTGRSAPKPSMDPSWPRDGVRLSDYNGSPIPKAGIVAGGLAATAAAGAFGMTGVGSLLVGGVGGCLGGIAAGIGVAWLLDRCRLGDVAGTAVTLGGLGGLVAGAWMHGILPGWLPVAVCGVAGAVAAMATCAGLWEGVVDRAHERADEKAASGQTHLSRLLADLSKRPSLHPDAEAMRQAVGALEASGWHLGASRSELATLMSSGASDYVNFKVVPPGGEPQTLGSESLRVLAHLAADVPPDAVPVAQREMADIVHRQLEGGMALFLPYDEKRLATSDERLVHAARLVTQLQAGQSIGVDTHGFFVGMGEARDAVKLQQRVTWLKQRVAEIDTHVAPLMAQGALQVRGASRLLQVADAAPLNADLRQAVDTVQQIARAMKTPPTALDEAVEVLGGLVPTDQRVSLADQIDLVADVYRRQTALNREVQYNGISSAATFGLRVARTLRDEMAPQDIGFARQVLAKCSDHLPMTRLLMQTVREAPSMRTDVERHLASQPLQTLLDETARRQGVSQEATALLTEMEHMEGASTGFSPRWELTTLLAMRDADAPLRQSADEFFTLKSTLAGLRQSDQAGPIYATLQQGRRDGRFGGATFQELSDILVTALFHGSSLQSALGHLEAAAKLRAGDGVIERDHKTLRIGGIAVPVREASPAVKD